jgi:hypothetical protein
MALQISAFKRFMLSSYVGISIVITACDNHAHKCGCGAPHLYISYTGTNPIHQARPKSQRHLSEQFYKPLQRKTRCAYQLGKT